MGETLSYLNDRLADLDKEEKLALKDCNIDRAIEVVTIKNELLDIRRVLGLELGIIKTIAS